MIVIQIVAGARFAQETRWSRLAAIRVDGCLPRERAVQPQHAVIRQVAGRWLIESQGAGLIRVGNGVPTKDGVAQPRRFQSSERRRAELIFDRPSRPQPEPRDRVRTRELWPINVRRRPCRHREPWRSPRSSPVPRDRTKPADGRSPATAAGLSQFHRRLVWLLLAGGLVVAGIALVPSGRSGAGADRNRWDSWLIATRARVSTIRNPVAINRCLESAVGSGLADERRRRSP